jgi:nucleoid DNA-binding protein
MAKKKNKYSFVNELHESVLKAVEVTKRGEVRLKRTDLKNAIEKTFQQGLISAAGGERVRFPVIGALVRRDVPARKAGKGTNPFTGEPMTIKARPASKKPRWSFPKSVRQVFANKKYW